MNWNDKICKVFATTFRSGYDSEELNRLVHDLISEMVFDTEMFEKYQILTSKEIQKNFFRVISRRKNFEMEHPEYLLIAIPEKRTNWGNVCKNGEIAYKNAKNVDNFQQSKVKESKVKESKENTTPCSRAREGETKYSFPDLCRSYRAELAKDEEWLFAVSQLSGQGGAEIKKHIDGAMDVFETHLVSTGETGSILHINDYKRRFQYWWRCMGFEPKENLLARSRTSAAYRADTSPKTRSEQMDVLREEAKKALSVTFGLTQK